MIQSLNYICSESEGGKLGELLFEQYSSDCHLLALLFGGNLTKEPGRYSAVKVVSDINALNLGPFSQCDAIIILCELERYSAIDVTTFLERVKPQQIPLLTVSITNFHLLDEYGVSSLTNALRLPLRVDEMAKFVQHVKTAGRRIAVDLHSSQLPLDR